MTASRILRVGLTGGIASGKSLVADLFAAHGAPVIDTDIIAREVVEPGTAGLAEVVRKFGSEYLTGDGQLNRSLLRTRVFADAQSRAQLEAIIHPRIRAATLHQADNAGGPYQIIAVPLLTETKFHELVDRVLVVDCPTAVQVRRLMERDQESEDSARTMVAAQATRAERLAIADDIILNDGTIRQLEDAVARLHARYQAMAASPAA